MTRERGLLFDGVADDYDRARPSYPDELVDRACAGLAPGSRVLEVGCGTGKLTVALAARGFRIDAVDPGQNLLRVARERVSSDAVRFHHGRFEDVDLPAGAFEALFSATAFHWVDPDVGWAKAARVLRPGGTLALLTHVGGSHVDLQDALLAAWRAVVAEAEKWSRREDRELWAGAEERRENVSAVWGWLEKRDDARPEAAELFHDVRIDKVRLEIEETADELIGLVRTQSAYLALDASRRERLEELLAEAVERAGGAPRATVFAVLVTARRRN